MGEFAEVLGLVVKLLLSAIRLPMGMPRAALLSPFFSFKAEWKISKHTANSQGAVQQQEPRFVAPSSSTSGRDCCFSLRLLS